MPRLSLRFAWIASFPALLTATDFAADGAAVPPSEPQLLSCAPHQLPACANLVGTKTPAGGAEFAWDYDGFEGREFHLNTVNRKELINSVDPKLPSTMPLYGGVGILQCLDPTFTTRPTCIDPDAVADPEPLLFYQAIASCGGLDGATEGKVFP